MDSKTIFILMIAFMAARFAWKQALSAKNRSMMSPVLPDAAAGVYDQGEYAKQQDYQRENNRMSGVFGIIAFALGLAFLVFGVYGRLDAWLGAWAPDPYVRPIVFMAIFALISKFAGLPFDIYDTFVIEEKYGFNKTTRKTFAKDFVLTTVLLLALSAGLALLIAYAYRAFGQWFLPICVCVLLAILVAFMYFFQQIIVPLFNKQTPLEPGTLRDAIEAFCQKTGFPLTGVYVIDGSKRSTKANAYLAGFGKKKRIVLYDTLIGGFDEAEIVAVLAHEIGHWKGRHILANLLLGAINIIGMLWFVYICIGNEAVADALGALGGAAGPGRATVELGMQGGPMLYIPVSIILTLLSKSASRSFEWKADAYAAENGYGEQLATGLKKLAKTHLDNLTPHPWTVFWEYDHPPILERAARLAPQE